MKTLTKAVLAGLATVAIHFCFEILGTLVAEGGAVHGLLRPLSWQTAPRYLAAFVVQAVVFVFAYVMVGQRLPGSNMFLRGVLFGLLIYLLSGVAAMAPMALVFTQPLPLTEVILVGVLGTPVLSVSMGVAFVAVWESVLRR